MYQYYSERGSAWFQTGKQNLTSSLPEDSSFDWVVVGAGFTGLSVTRTLAEMDSKQSILLVDGLPIAAGNAGRSSGFVVSLGHFNTKHQERNRILYKIGSSGLKEIKRLVSKFDIDCDFVPKGRILCASGSAAKKELKKIQSVLKQVGSAFENLSAEQIAEKTGRQPGSVGILQNESFMLKPSSLIQGLANNLPANASTITGTPVHHFKPSSDRVQIQIGSNTVTTRKMILTVNGLTPNLGLLRKRILPVRIFASLASVNDDPSSHLPPWGLTTAGEVGTSFRKLPCGRYLIRNGIRLSGSSNRSIELAKFANRHQELFRYHFPNSKHWKIESTWSAPIGISANSSFYFGQLGPNVYGVAGHNGHGIATGTALGKLMAKFASGKSHIGLQDVLDLPGPSWIPGQFLSRMGAKFMVRYLNFLFRKEM